MLTRSQNSNKVLNESFMQTLKSKHQVKKKEVIIRALLASGANINQIDSLGNTPLHLASRCNEVYLLFKLGADPNIKNFDGDTPLLHIIKKVRTVPVGARKKLFKKSKVLISEFIRNAYRNFVLYINLQDSKGNSPLFEYVHKNECDISIVKQFIQLGANFNITASNQNTLLHAAVSNSYCKIDVVNYLLQLGLDPNAENSHRQTPLHCCVRIKDFKLDIVEVLMNHGTDVLQQDSSGNTPLYFAVLNAHCNQELLNVLLHGIEPYLINERLRSGGTLLHKVVSHNDISVMEKLISCGANVNATDDLRCTPLHLAVSVPYCDENIVSLLVICGADVNARNNNNSTPLHKAFENTANMAVIKTLLHYEAKMCTLDYRGYTPLHYLIGNPNFETSYLMELLSTEKSIDSCLKLTATNKNFLYICYSSRKVYILKAVLKYLILKYHTWIKLRRFPLVMDSFFSRLGRPNWNVYDDFYRACMFEIDEMLDDEISDYINFYSVMVNEFSLLTLHQDNEEKKQIIDAVLVRMTNDQYPIYKDMVLYIRKQDFLKNLDAVRVSSIVYRDGSLRRITLDQFPVRHIAEYLSKQDVINLILAYSNITDSLETEADTSIDEENIRLACNSNLDFTREVRVNISRLSQGDMKKLCKPCTVVIQNDVETRMHAIDSKNEQHAGGSSSQLS